MGDEPLVLMERNVRVTVSTSRPSNAGLSTSSTTASLRLGSAKLTA